VQNGSTVGFQFHSLRAHPLHHGMSRRNPAYGLQGDVGHSAQSDPAIIEQNRTCFLTAVGVDPRDVAVGKQTHGTIVRVVGFEDRGRGLYPAFDGFPATDGLVTDDSSVAIGVIVADCVPILLYDRRMHAAGVVHAGWRGTTGLIAAEALRVMATAFGTSPGDIIAGIGPSIGPCCYEVGDEVIDAWRDASRTWGARAVIRGETSYHFDLWTANRRILVESGVPRNQIEDSAVCVRCQADRYFSYRATRQDGHQHGRMMMVAQLHSQPSLQQE
jgi:polyphenol oxidase